jgi:hypothetical protein
MEPQMDTDELGLNAITERIIGCSFTVANTLGHGFLEKVYENAWHTNYDMSVSQLKRRGYSRSITEMHSLGNT